MGTGTIYLTMRTSLFIIIVQTLFQPSLMTLRQESDNLYSNVDQELLHKWRDAIVNHPKHREERSIVEAKYANATDPRDSKFLSLFTVVQFENKECTNPGGTESGVCYTSSECSSLGGTDIGTCAYGYGTCCFFSITCGGSTSQNCSYLISPGYPNSYTDAQSCVMSVTKPSDSCQIKMEFEAFSSTQPSDAGKCATDQFTVDKDSKFRYLCGETPSSDWHFYIDVYDKTNPVTFTALTTTSGTERKFKIKLTFVPCSLRVPTGCGQYFTTDTGTIQSFNYGRGVYLAGQNYGICIRKNAGKCRVKIDRVGDSFISCLNDMYRQPVGVPVTELAIASFNDFFGYCQLPALANYMLESFTTAANGPINLYLITEFDTTSNSLNGVSGVHQTFTQQTC